MSNNIIRSLIASVWQPLVVVTIFVAFLLFVGYSSDKNAAKTLVGAANELNDKYSYLRKEFGQVPHFIESLDMALLKKGASIQDLLILDELAVKQELKEEYIGIAKPLANLTSLFHSHPDDGFHVAGGYRLIGIEEQKDSEALSVYFGPVTKRIVEKVESMVDKQVDTSLEDSSTGIVRFSRNKSTNGQFVLAFFFP